jgi:hypothetical protein
MSKDLCELVFEQLHRDFHKNHRYEDAEDKDSFLETQLNHMNNLEFLYLLSNTLETQKRASEPQQSPLTTTTWSVVISMCEALQSRPLNKDTEATMKNLLVKFRDLLNALDLETDVLPPWDN